MIFSRFVICSLVLFSSCTMKSKEELNQASNHIDLEKLSVNPENFIRLITNKDAIDYKNRKPYS